MRRLAYGVCVAFLAGTLSGCGGPPTSTPAAGSAAPPAVAPTTSQTAPAARVTTSDLVSAFQDLEMAIQTFRNMEAANTGSSGVLRGAGYVAASSAMQKKRDAFDRMLAAANPADVPDIAAIRTAYKPFQSALKGYITVTSVGGIISGPDAKASTPSYLLLAAESIRFRGSLNKLQRQQSAAAAGTANEILAAEKASQDAYKKLQELIHTQGEAVAIKAAAEQYDAAKKHFEELTRR